MLFEPKLNEENFQKAKREIMFALEGIPKSAITAATETMYKGTRLAITPIILRQKMEKVTLQDVQQYYTDILKDAQADAIITGPISQVEKLGEKIKEEFSSITHSFGGRTAKLTKIAYSNRKQVVVQAEKGRTQSQIVQLFHIDTNDLQDTAALKVMDSILGGSIFNSKLHTDLREKQKLCYYTESWFSQSPNFGQEFLAIETGIKDKNGIVNNNIEKSILAFEKHIKSLIEKPVTKEELARAKRIITSNYKQMFATAYGQNEKLTTSLSTEQGVEHYDELLKAINAVTEQDIQRVAKKYLTTPSVTSILTTEEAAQKAQAFLKTRGEFKLFSNEEV
jgi:predicted Zn-dependent peptidase